MSYEFKEKTISISTFSYYQTFFYYIYHTFTLFMLLSHIILSYLWVIYKIKILEEPYSWEKLKKKHRKNAILYKKTSLKLRGGLIKFAQFISSQKNLIVDEVIEELESLQDRVDPIDSYKMRKILELEVGDSIDNIFSEFDDEPIAAASFGQVHKAKLKDGTTVAVKIQYPFIETTLTIDMMLMRYFITILSTLLNKKHMIDAYKEIKDALFLELDYGKEGEYATKFKQNFSDYSDVIVPTIYHQFSTKKVLVMDYIDGYKINNISKMSELNILPYSLLKIIIDSYFKQFYCDGFFHSDPHPGNLFFTSNAKIAFIDFGQSKELPEYVKLALIDSIGAVLSFDLKKIVDSFIKMGLIKEVDRGRMGNLLDNIFSRIETGSANEIMGITLDFNFLHQNVVSLIQEMNISFPSGVVLYGRTLAYLNGLIASLSPDANMFEITRESFYKRFF